MPSSAISTARASAGRVARVVTTVLCALALAAGCTGADPAPAPSATAEPTATQTATATAGSGDATEIVGPECEAGPGRTVENLPDVVIPAAVVPGVRTEDVEYGGTTVPGVTVEEVRIPAQLVDAGCIITYDAPAGCLPAVEITGSTIPGTAIPERELPERRLPDGSVIPREHTPEKRVDEVVVEGVRAEQVCQVVEGEFTPGVMRPGVFRASAFRPSVFAESLFQASHCDDDCVPSTSLPSAAVSSVAVESAAVESASIPSVRLEAAPEVEQRTEPERTSYVAPGDVLFDVDSSDVRPDAETALRAIAADIAATAPQGTLLVQGHTDDQADDAYNQTLSERRAQAVADWLVQRAGVDPSRITVTGYGESAPTAPNESEENRRLNRRVVISVTH